MFRSKGSGSRPAPRPWQIPNACARRRRCWEMSVQLQMRRQIGRRTKRSVHDLALEIGNHHVLRLQFFVGNAAGLDGDEPSLAIDAAGIAEGVERRGRGEPVPGSPRAPLRGMSSATLGKMRTPNSNQAGRIFRKRLRNGTLNVTACLCQRPQKTFGFCSCDENIRSIHGFSTEGYSRVPSIMNIVYTNRRIGETAERNELTTGDSLPECDRMSTLKP